MGKTKTVIILLHGLGAHGQRWEFLKKYLAQHKFIVYAPDLPGSGRLREQPLSFASSFEYLTKLRKTILRKHPHARLILGGESLGGLIAYRYLQLHPDSFAGLFCYSPAFKSKLKFNIWEYLLMALTMLVWPGFKIKAHFSAAMCTSDEHYQQKMKDNPLETRWIPVGYYREVLWQQVLAQTRSAGQLSVPVLFQLAGHDEMVDSTTSKKILARQTGVKTKVITYPQLRHALSIEKARGIVFRDTLQWLRDEGML